MGKGGHKTTNHLPKPVPRAAEAYSRQLKNVNSLNESTLNHATHVVSHQYWPPRELDYRYSAWPTIYTYITDTDNILFT